MCLIIYNEEKFLIIQTFPPYEQEPVTRNASDDGWGQPIPAGLSYLPPINLVR